MTKITKFIAAVALFFLTLSNTVHANKLPDFHGKIDIAPTYINLDLLQSGEKVRNLKLEGISANAAVFLWKGLMLRPMLMYASDNDAGKLYTAGLGLGFYLPVGMLLPWECKCLDNLGIIPGASIKYSHLKVIDRRDLFITIVQNQYMRSRGQALSLDITYKFLEKYRITGIVNYSWNQTTTTFDLAWFPTTETEVKGFNYYLTLDYEFKDNWTMGIGAGLEKSKSKELHGSKGSGARISLGRIF